MTLKTQIKLRSDVLGNWEANYSKHLALGEIGIAYQCVNTSDNPEEPHFEKKNFQIRIGKELSGTHWNDSARIQAEDFTDEFYAQLTSQLSTTFVLKTEQNDLYNQITSEFWPAISGLSSAVSAISNDVSVLKAESIKPEVSSEILYFNKIIDNETLEIS